MDQLSLQCSKGRSDTDCGNSLTSSYQMGQALQATLKRVSRDIQLRKNGASTKDSKQKQPLPPVYEMVGNSIAYQLLLQPHPSITVDLINSMYPILKNIQGSAQWLFDEYLEMFKMSLSKKATPQCLHPADVPTVKFLVDLCVHVSSIPMDDNYISPNPSLWMNILAIFSASPQNAQCLVEFRCSSKIVGCMNLTSMADDIKLQCYGWEILTNILQCPPQDINKPAVHLQAVTLLLSHIRRQCEQFYYDDQLMTAVLKFLSKLTSIIRVCSLDQQPTTTDSTSTPMSYSKGDSIQIISLLEQTSIRQLLLDLPEHLQDDLTIKTTLQSVLLSLAPTIVVPPDQSNVSNNIATNAAVPTKRFPPPKPKRSKTRSQYFSSIPSYDPSISTATQSGSGTVEQQLGVRPSRKLPSIPKRMSLSKSSDDLSSELSHHTESTDYPAPDGRTSPSMSVPVGIITYATSRRSSKKTNKLPTVIAEHQPESIPRSLTSGPEQLPHYNRVSKKRTRNSYIKAVTSSQKVTDKPKDSFTNLYEAILRDGEGIAQTLSERREMELSIMQLWKSDKGLQAASNLVMSCFFGDDTDVPLFADCLECFCVYPSHWSLGICIVLLPYMRKILVKDIKTRYLKAIDAAISLIMKRFSVVILGVKKNQYPSRVHLEQRQACYHDLHLMFATVAKLDKTMQDKRSEIQDLISILRPFNEPL